MNIPVDFINVIITKYGCDIPDLNLSSNGLTSLNHIEKLKDALKTLNLSRNSISDLKPLSSLTNLVQLNLSQNNISSIEPLRDLSSSLEVLDLSGNRLTSFESLAATIRRMNKLHTILLIGNAVCSNSNYPEKLFELQPSIMKIDDFLRPLSSRSSASAKITESEEIESLKVQLNAMRSAFELQEQALSENGLKMGKSTLMSNLIADKSSSSSSAADTGTASSAAKGTITPWLKKKGEGREAMDERERATESFPYQRLLQVWRNAALECQVSKAMLYKKVERVMSESKSERSSQQQKLIAQEMQTLKWKHRCDDLEQECHRIGQQYNAAADQLAKDAHTHHRMESALDRNKNDLHSMVMCVRNLSEKDASSAVAARSWLLSVTSQLSSFEERVRASADRVAFAASIVAQKEVKLRNSFAALEAEKRLLQLRAQKMKGTDEGGHNTNANSNRESSSTSGGRPSGSGTSSTCLNYVEGIRTEELAEIQPEAEALLRAVYRQLDGGDVGRMSLMQFFQGVLGSCAGGSRNWNASEAAAEKPASEEHYKRCLDRSLTLLRSAYARNETIPGCLRLLMSRGKKNRSEVDEDVDKGNDESFEDSSEGLTVIGRSREDSGVDGGEDECSGLFSPLGSFMCRAVGSGLWMRLLGGLASLLPLNTRHRADTTPMSLRYCDYSVTWGEFLLQLVPQSGDHLLTRYSGTIEGSAGHTVQPSPHSKNTYSGAGAATEDNPLSWDQLRTATGSSTDIGNEDEDEDRHYIFTSSRARDVGSCGAQLTPEERTALGKAGLLDVVDWSRIRLSIPEDELAVTTVNGRSNNNSKNDCCGGVKKHGGGGGGRTSSTSSSHSYHQLQRVKNESICSGGSLPSSSRDLQADVLALTDERSYLLRQLQEASRCAERRAEGIKAYFEAELKRNQMTHSRLQSKVQESQSAVAVLEERLREQAESASTERARLEQRLDMYEQECDNLRSSMTASRKDDVLRYEGLIRDAEEKLSRAQTELNLAQREAGKKEVKCKALQRDALRLQSAHQAQVSESESLRDQLAAESRRVAESVRAAEQELHKGREQWAAEKEELMTKIIALQEEAAAGAAKLATVTAAAAAASAAAAAEKEPSAAVASKPIKMDPTEAEQQRLEQIRATRSQLDTLRNMTPMNVSRTYEKQQTGTGTGAAEENILNPNVLTVNDASEGLSGTSSKSSTSNDLYSAHLSKLLRLAENALGSQR